MASNLLLDLMPGHVREELLDSGADLCVPAGQGVAQELLGGTHVFIVTKGIAAKFQRAENGRISEVGMVGAEGMFPASALLQVPAAPHIILSLTGDLIGRRIRTKDFHRIVEESAAAVLLLQKYIYAFITQISSNIVSSEQNHVTSRLARWLLMFHDRVADDDIPVTHDMLAHMTFSHRPTAISPEAIKAAIRVNRPSAISTPATSSMTPAAISIAGNGPGIWNGIGNARNLTVACSRNSSPATIRKAASARGDQRTRLGINFSYRPVSLRRASGSIRPSTRSLSA
jgi:CRP-like cAMP-binding protein